MSFDVKPRNYAEAFLLDNVIERAAEAVQHNSDSYKACLDILSRHGRFFDPSPLPQPPGKPGYCTYNVGRALGGGLPTGWAVAIGYWSHNSGHVWLVDPDGRAVDPTTRGDGLVDELDPKGFNTGRRVPMPRFGFVVPLSIAAACLEPLDAAGVRETGSHFEFCRADAVMSMAEKYR